MLRPPCRWPAQRSCVAQHPDQAVDAVGARFLGEGIAVRGHQADAVDRDVVDLPAAAGGDHLVIYRDRLHARLQQPRAHDGLALVLGLALRIELQRLALELAERRGVGAHQQRAELICQFGLLLRRRLAPAESRRQRGHAREIEMPQHLFLDQCLDLGPSGVVLVFLQDLQHFLADALDQRIGFLGGGARGQRQRQCDQQDRKSACPAAQGACCVMVHGVLLLVT
jgi:hypothetical protein